MYAKKKVSPKVKTTKSSVMKELMSGMAPKTAATTSKGKKGSPASRVATVHPKKKAKK